MKRFVTNLKKSHSLNMFFFLKLYDEINEIIILNETCDWIVCVKERHCVSIFFHLGIWSVDKPLIFHTQNPEI